MKDYREIAENVFRRRDEYEAKKAARNRHLRRITTALTVFAISIVFLFTAGTCYVFAVGLGIAEDPLGICDRLFFAPVTPKQQAVVENATVELGDVVTCDGFAVTAKSAFTDGTTALILIQIYAPEHIDLELNAPHFNIDAKGIVRGDNPNKILGADGLRITQLPIDDQDGAKNTQNLLLKISTTKAPGYDFSFADGYDRYMRLEGLYAYEEDYPYTKYQIAEGNWDFRIRFDDAYSHEEKEMLKEPIRLTSRRALYDVPQTATVHSIIVKGLSIVFRYSYGADAVQEPGDFGNVQIILKDGTVIDTKCSTGDLGTYKGEFVTTYLATAPILVNEIDHIRIGENYVLNGQIAHHGNPLIPLPEE